MATLNGRGNAEEASGLDEEYGQANGFREHRIIEKKPHQSVGFWHRSMSKVRKDVIWMWIRTGKSLCNLPTPAADVTRADLRSPTAHPD